MAHSRAYPWVLVRQQGCSDGPGTDQDAAFDATRLNSRSKLACCAVMISATGIARRKIFRGVTLFGKPDSETFLTLKSQVVRSKPYVHDYSSKQPHLACEVGLYSISPSRISHSTFSCLSDLSHCGFLSEELLLSAPDWIGCDQAITSEPR